MTDTRTTDLTELTTVADGDRVPVVDVSDTTSSSAGTTKYAQAKNIRGYPVTAAETSAAVTIVNYQYPVLNVLRYGTNTVEGTTDMTVAIQAAVDVAYTQGGGTVFIPAGTYGVTAVTKEFFTKRINVNITGEGKSATVLQKIGITTTPIIHFYATGTGPIDTYSRMSAFQVSGLLKANDGIRLTRIAKNDLYDVEIINCDTGFDNLGTQIFNAYNVALSSNNVGYMSRISEAIYANVVNFYGGQATDNTSFGFDIGQCSGVHLNGVFIYQNGTTTDLATGSVIIRSTVDDEFGGSIVDINDCWFEKSDGMALKVEAATGLHLSVRNTEMIASEGGNVADIGAIKSLKLDNVIALTTGDTVISAAGRTLIVGGIIHTYTDNSITTKINFTDSAAITTSIKAVTATGYQLMDEAAGLTNPTLVPNRDTLNSGITGISGDIGVVGEGTLVGYFEAPANLLATETSFYLYDLDNAAIRQVTVGADDSGGAGYKVLRIVN